ncbi:MAG: hypothetical protein QOJ80_1099 [Mycobacterium sp.]|nr:hypothetical protein [Mycobacterium sp.]
MVGAEQDLAGSLIVDAMGCGARTPAFLERLGYGRPIASVDAKALRACPAAECAPAHCCSPLIAARCFRCTAAGGTTSSDALAEDIGGRLALVQNEFHLPGHAQRSDEFAKGRLRRSTVEISGNPTRFIRPGDGDPRHGSDNGYSNLRCRCQHCRQAWARTYQKRRERKRNEPTPVGAHGTVSGYSYWGCRCAKCTEIHSEHHRQLRYRRRSEQSLIQRDGRVPVTASVNMAADAKDGDPRVE